MDKLGQLTEIYIYPVKSLAGVKLDKALVTKYGLAHPDNHQFVDRKWLIIDENNSFLTQRQLSRLALIKPRLDADNMILSAPDKPDLVIPIKPPTSNKKLCRVWNSHIEGYAYGGEIAQWLSSFLAKEVDLVCFGEDLQPRWVKKLKEEFPAREQDATIYADYSPYMLISEASLEDLNGRLDEKVSMRNFRPNFSVKGCEAFAEDNWKNFTIGPAKFCQIKHCTRCLLTTVDPNKGERSPSGQPLKTLKEYRRNKPVYGDSPLFGINIAPDNEQVHVSVGDEVVLA